MVKSIDMIKNISEFLNMFMEYAVDQIGVDFESPLEDNEMEASELINNFVKKNQDKIKAMTPKESEGKDGKKKKKAKDPNAPKKAKTGYMYFCDAKRAEVKEDNPEMKASEILSELGRLWGEMGEEDKEEYIEQAKEDKKRYESEYSEYEPSEGFTKKGEKKTRKRAPSGYILFCQDNREKVKNDNSEMNQTEITTELGKRWREASDKVKDKYNKKSKEMGEKLKKDKAESEEEKPKKTGKTSKAKEEEEDEEVEEKPSSKKTKAKKAKEEEEEEEEEEEKPSKKVKEDKKKKEKKAKEDKKKKGKEDKKKKDEEEEEEEEEEIEEEEELLEDEE